MSTAADPRSPRSTPAAAPPVILVPLLRRSEFGIKKIGNFYAVPHKPVPAMGGSRTGRVICNTISMASKSK